MGTNRYLPNVVGFSYLVFAMIPLFFLNNDLIRNAKDKEKENTKIGS
jgi:hypothetical protein